jgi:starch phosphorylase
MFTTHTPVEPGQDRFPMELVRSVLGEHHPVALGAEMHLHHGIVNMAYLALDFSRNTNAVSRRHREISTRLFPGYDIHAVTNGVHAGLWTSPAFAALYDRRLPQWRLDNFYLRDATSIPADEVWETHLEAKRGLLAQVERRAWVRLDPTVMTIGFARRAATYKRADLLFTHPERLARIVDRIGPLQIIFGGKAHPADEPGKEMIQRLFKASRALEKELRIVYLEDYDMALGQLLCAGVDLWLNNPQKPLEASGTSGMKAALNGVPSLSVLDGWWTEGHHEGLTGWSIGNSQDPEEQELELDTLYDKLEYVIVPLFYRQPLAYAAVMRGAIALNGSFFNTQRMLLQYIRNAYATALQVQAAAERR